MLSTTWRNYLRVRGEYALIDLSYERIEELPPRARRILNEINRQFGGLGTTSACAENTRVWHFFGHGLRNYLRVRGEYGEF